MLEETVSKLQPLDPHYVSVTYGAGGSTQDGTVSTLKHLVAKGLTCAGHLTCVNASKETVNAVAQAYWDAGVKHIVALRGDMPGEDSYTPHPEGYAYADDLVVGLKQIADFEITVAAYPETHPAALSPEADIEHLKRKFDAGADQAVTQYFFNTDDYFRFMDRVRDAGITQPIIPGVMPVHNFEQVARFSAMCGATVPNWMAEMFADVKDDPEQTRMVAMAIATEQCRRLIEWGVDEMHIYALNRWEITHALCAVLTR